MRFTSVAAIAGIAGVTIALLAGCGGSPNSSSAIPLTGAMASRSRPLLSPRWSFPQGLEGLYIIDDNSGTFSVDVVNNQFTKLLGTIAGFNCPSGDFLDAAGNLYVADPCNDVVDEFALGAKSPTFTYSAGMTGPNNVIVDGSGNVYEADSAGVVNEYAQGSNTVLYSCSPGRGGVQNVAVDKLNDVFVLYDSANIAVYKGGLSGCHHGKAFALGLNALGGMALDRNKNLIVSEPGGGGPFMAGVVFVIAPPYSGITATLGSGYLYPTSIALNKANDLAFVTDQGWHVVWVLNYPSGSVYTTVSGFQGISDPYAAVDGPNAIY